MQHAARVPGEEARGARPRRPVHAHRHLRGRAPPHPLRRRPGPPAGAASAAGAAARLRYPGEEEWEFSLSVIIITVEIIFFRFSLLFFSFFYCISVELACKTILGGLWDWAFTEEKIKQNKKKEKKAIETISRVESRKRRAGIEDFDRACEFVYQLGFNPADWGPSEVKRRWGPGCWTLPPAHGPRAGPTRQWRGGSLVCVSVDDAVKERGVGWGPPRPRPPASASPALPTLTRVSQAGIGFATPLCPTLSVSYRFRMGHSSSISWCAV